MLILVVLLDLHVFAVVVLVLYICVALSLILASLYICVCVLCTCVFCFILFCVWCALVVGCDFLAPNEDIMRFRCESEKSYTLLCIFL